MTSSNDSGRPDEGMARPSRRGGAYLLSLAVAVLIAAVLQFAAAAKVAHGADVLRRMKSAATNVEHGLATDFDPADYQWIVGPDEGFRGGIPLDFAIAAGEFLLVVLVLAGHRGRAVWLLVPLVFSSFLGFALQRSLNGLPCGCFGELWRPPDGVSMAFDAAFVALAFVIAAMRRTHRSVLIATGVLSLASLAGGYFYAISTMGEPGAGAPERRDAPALNPGPVADPNEAQRATGDAPPTFDEGLSAPEKLLASALMADAREAHSAGEPTAYYVFIWDPTCSTCERLKPVVEQYKSQLEEEANPFLQVRLFKKQDLRDRLGIQPYEWDSSPYVFAVQGGEVVALPGGDDAPLPDEILEKLASDQPLVER